MKTKITLAQARKVLKVVDAGLTKGIGVPTPGSMCVEAAVCYALGQPHSDEPECVDSDVRAFKIVLNDKYWSSRQARAAGMRKIAIAQLGSKDTIDFDAFKAKVAELTTRRIVPIALRKLASHHIYKDRLEAAAARCEKEGTLNSVLSAKEVFGKFARPWYVYACLEQVIYSYQVATRAAQAAEYAALASGADPEENDRLFGICAEIGVEALRFAKSPGIALMDKLIK